MDNIVVNDEGGKQSDTLGRFDLIPPEALLVLAKVYKEGAEKYEVNNWHNIPLNSHLNHCLEHLVLFEFGDISDDHLAHAFCRLSMAIWARGHRES